VSNLDESVGGDCIEQDRAVWEETPTTIGATIDGRPVTSSPLPTVEVTYP
jgi:hypothetical protein